MSDHPSNKIGKSDVFQIFNLTGDGQAALSEGQADSRLIIAVAAKNLVVAILNCAPDCADRSAAIRCAREAAMWATAAIALEPDDL